MEGVREQAMRKGRRPTIANSTQMFELRKRTASNNFINGDFDSDGEQEQKDNNNSSGNMNKPEVPKDNDYTMRLKMCLFLESLYSAVEIGVSL